MRHASCIVGFLAALVLMSAAGAQTVLITGSNRGIGLEFAKQYADKGWTVIATHRRDATTDTKRQGITVALLSPGTVKVEKVAEMVDRMGLKGFIEPPESIVGMISVIESLAPGDSGAFIRYNGEPQPF